MQVMLTSTAIERLRVVMASRDVVRKSERFQLRGELI
jgi:hypothetical protein